MGEQGANHRIIVDVPFPSSLITQPQDSPLMEPTINSETRDQLTSAQTITLVAGEESQAKTSLQCQICLKVFKRNFHLKRHQLTHTDHRPHKCDHCEKSFTRRDDRERHHKIHGM